MRYNTIIFFSLLITISACSNKSRKVTNDDNPVSRQLYDTIVYCDSVFFNAYNTCNMDMQAAIYSDSIEFYHDKGGLMTSKQELLDATKKNICGKVTRELVTGSIEVYPIKDFGAVEMGFHRFHNNTEKEDTVSKPDRFIIIWKHTNKQWQISRVVSLH
jgi:hypothetical protein